MIKNAKTTLVLVFESLLFVHFLFVCNILKAVLNNEMVLRLEGMRVIFGCMFKLLRYDFC